MKVRHFVLAFAAFHCCSDGAEMAEERLKKELEEIQRVRATLTAREREIYTQLRELKEGIDKTKGLSDRCPVHNEKMQVRRVPIAYGMRLRPLSDRTDDIRKREFPFALDYWDAGCIAGKHTHAKTYVCPACQEAEKAWKAFRAKRAR